MTSRLYYNDAATLAFDARVERCRVADGRTIVVLDRTAFYPTSGGQPHDLGRIDDVDVVEVLEDDAGDVVHVTAGPLDEGRVVHGRIDAARRRDHMQQHTGQHVLSAAFDRLVGVGTVSFHMGGAISTIDLAREVDAAEIGRAEAAANDVVFDDRPVAVRFVSEEDAARLPLRREAVRKGTLRLVEIEDFDLSACGGTHVARTGQIGMIAVTGWERVRGATRVTFVCGGRALRSHREFRDVVHATTRLLSVTGGELPAAVERLQADARALDRAARTLRQDLADRRAADLRAAAAAIGPYRVVIAEEPVAEADALKALARAVVAAPGLVVLLIGAGEPLPVVIARSADVALDAGALVRAMAAGLGGRGGGRPDLAQAGLPGPADGVMAFVRRALSDAR